jgi:septal ring factor EnvC (AmiA/AmiB activator)
MGIKRSKNVLFNFDFCICLHFVNNSQWLRDSLKVMRRWTLHPKGRSQRTLLFKNYLSVMFVFPLRPPDREIHFQELRNTTDDVKKVEGQVIEIARLQEIFSEKILQQEGDINRIGENLMGTTDNLQMANEQIREAIKNNAGFRVWILFFLVVLTFSLLFLDWYND